MGIIMRLFDGNERTHFWASGEQVGDCCSGDSCAAIASAAAAVGTPSAVEDRRFAAKQTFVCPRCRFPLPPPLLEFKLARQLRGGFFFFVCSFLSSPSHLCAMWLTIAGTAVRRHRHLRVSKCVRVRFRSSTAALATGQTLRCALMRRGAGNALSDPLLPPPSPCDRATSLTVCRCRRAHRPALPENGGE